MFRDGRSLGEISVARHTSVHVTIGSLLRLIGQGKLRRSDVFYSVPREWREPVITIIDVGVAADPQRIRTELEQNGCAVPLADVQIVCAFYDKDSAFGDMYEDIRSIECELHWLVRREEDPEPLAEPYFYTDLMHLWKLIEKNWAVMVERLPRSARDKPRLKADLLQLNRIRNQVMHPVRGEQIREQHFEFVRDLRIKLGFRLDLPTTEGMPNQISQAGR